MQSLRLAVRKLLQTPLLTFAALGSLALGIGANTTIFSLVDAVFLRGLGVVDPERVVSVFVTSDDPRLANALRMSHPNFEDLARRTTSFAQLTEIAPALTTVTLKDGEPQRVNGQMVTSSFFPLLGIRPALGRYLNAEEDANPGAHPVLVLSDRAWRQWFGGDPSAIGRQVTLNRQPFTVVGVAPPGFRGTLLLVEPAFWVPLSMYQTFLPGDQQRFFQDRRSLFGRAYGRLKPGVSLEQARGELAALGAALEQEFPLENKGRGLGLLPLNQAAVEPEQRAQLVRAGLLLMGAVALVLAIAVINVANLQLARAASRRREIGVRLALGASRARLVGQLLAESLLLSLAAGALGLLLAWGGQRLLWDLRPPNLANAPIAPTMNLGVLAFTLGLSLLAGLLFGLMPALQSTRPELVGDLKQPTDGASGVLRLFSLRNLLVMAQVALCLVALTGAGLFLRSLSRATVADLGFRAEGLGSLRFDLATGYNRATGELFLDRLLGEARSLPGVVAATIGARMPLGEGGGSRTVTIEGRAPDAANNRLMVQIDSVEPGYAAVLGLPLVAGRDLEPLDRADTTPVALINEVMAETFWPGESALGQRFRLAGEDKDRQVVGIVGNAKHAEVTESPVLQLLLPRRQAYQPGAVLVVRAAGEPAALVAALRERLRKLDPSLTVLRAETVADRVRQSLWAPRMAASLLGGLGAVALLLAAVGIYGVTAYTVGQRARELAIRSSLGADRGKLLSLVVGRGSLVTGLGLIVGWVLAALAARSIAGLLFGVSALDPASYLGTALVLAAISLVASFVPAQRAARVDPARVLTFER